MTNYVMCGCSTGGLCDKHSYLANRMNIDTAGNVYVTDQFGNFKINLNKLLTVEKDPDFDFDHTGLFKGALVRTIRLESTNRNHRGANNVLLAIMIWCAMAEAKRTL